MSVARFRPVVGLFALSLLASACGAGADPFEIGLRRVALDLAFEDAEIAADINARQIVRRIVFVEQEVLEQIPEGPVRQIIRIIPRPTLVCPKADANQTPELPAFAVVKDPPTVGRYGRHNTGTLEIQIGTGEPFTLPYPSRTAWEVDEVGDQRVLNYVNSDAGTTGAPDEVQADDNAFKDRVDFQLTRITSPSFRVTDHFRYSRGDAGASGDFLWLIKRVTVVNGQPIEFNPTPPIRYLRLFTVEGPDSEVAHGGIDRDTNVAMAVQSRIVGREWVDVCGENHDTYRVEISESMIDLSSDEPETSGNEPGGQTNVWNIQFDNGLLVLREEVHTTLRSSIQGPADSRIPVVVNSDYVSVLDSIEPGPLED